MTTKEMTDYLNKLYDKLITLNNLLKEVNNHTHTHPEGVGIRITDASQKTNDGETECPDESYGLVAPIQIQQDEGQQKAPTKCSGSNADAEISSLSETKPSSCPYTSLITDEEKFIKNSSTLHPFINQQGTDESFADMDFPQNAVSPVDDYLNFLNGHIDIYTFNIILDEIECNNNEKTI